MKAFAIAFRSGIYLAFHDHVCPEQANSGWRPFVWTKKVEKAEKFLTSGAARNFGERSIPHSAWHVTELTENGAQPVSIA
jgi:hypothetical protein